MTASRSARAVRDLRTPRERQADRVLAGAMAVVVVLLVALVAVVSAIVGSL